VNTDGSFSYTPNALFSGTDSFTFKANDGLADSNAGTVTITVNHVNHAPTANDGVADGQRGQQQRRPVRSPATDVDNG